MCLNHTELVHKHVTHLAISVIVLGTVLTLSNYLCMHVIMYSYSQLEREGKKSLSLMNGEIHQLKPDWNILWLRYVALPCLSKHLTE